MDILYVFAVLNYGLSMAVFCYSLHELSIARRNIEDAKAVLDVAHFVKELESEDPERIDDTKGYQRCRSL